MHDHRALKLLAYLERRLEAEQCRIEIGGEPHDDPRWIWVSIGEHRRVVAIFAEPPEDAEAVRDRLEAYVDAFGDTASVPPPDVAPTTALDGPKEVLHGELAAYAATAGALGVAVIDASSPIVWGRSHLEIGDDVPRLVDLVEPGEAGDARRGALELSDAPRARLLAVAEAVRRAREAVEASPHEVGTLHRSLGRGTDEPTGVYAFAGGYLLAVAFTADAFSETRAERALQQYRPRLERLVQRLPPVDPPPRGGRVLRLTRT